MSTKNKTEINKLKRAIAKHVGIIAAERDALRDLISDAEEICCDVDGAVEILMDAVEVLSQKL